MMVRALSADFLKIRGRGIWLLAIIGPLGIIALQAINFGIRYDYLTKLYAKDLWGGLLENIAGFVPLTLFLGFTLVCSLIANVEYQTSSWKQLLALPISRTAVFSSKFALTVIVLLMSCVLLTLGTIGLGLALKFDAPIPYMDIAKLGFYPFLAALPMLALQLWLSISFRNQGLGVSIGILCSVFSSFTWKAQDWMPLKWPILAYEGDNPLQFVMIGLICGIAVLLAGVVHFARKDVD
ncbi:ABC transporter permease [Paenibacillus sediminis]|uniref:Permease n=1 Tax=Paenibacillus sediminis TaxID=664909 RepID=A0ABS4H329_9BACL|nr:ABC transporter permease [Paenibacillus sediminis]MBP1936931.1 hypothetical protein [Paenibacillus sediminis]